MSFKSRVRKRSIIIAIIPLILACIFFMKLRVDDLNDEIKQDLKEISYVIANTPIVQNTLEQRKNNFEIQSYVSKFVKNFKNIDIIVVGDMTGEKYSHLDVNQIGQKCITFLIQNNHSTFTLLSVIFFNSYCTIFPLKEGAIGFVNFPL